MGKKIRKGINIITTILLVCIITLAVFVFVAKAQDRMFFLFGKSFIWVLTPSMEDTIPAQSYILVEEVTASDVKVGDVIVFKSSDPKLNGSLNTHRVVAISEDGQKFETKGDNNVVKDSVPAEAQNIKARYVKNLPVLTFFGRILTSTAGFFTLVAVVAVLCIAFTVPDFVKYAKEKNKKEEEKTMDALVAAEVERLKAKEKAKQATKSSEGDADNNETGEKV